jgi:hypothetical protein
MTTTGRMNTVTSIFGALQAHPFRAAVELGEGSSAVFHRFNHFSTLRVSYCAPELALRG